mmetsp:Transcript_9837/g.1550  ORF Transcript_9837/g.1550 Transcript_9837/m.1550 type:complete len:88 (-) Transcript_9837:474-737(-)
MVSERRFYFFSSICYSGSSSPKSLSFTSFETFDYFLYLKKKKTPNPSKITPRAIPPIRIPNFMLRPIFRSPNWAATWESVQLPPLAM